MSGRTAEGGAAQREFWPALGHHAWKAPLLVNGLLIAGLLFLPKGSGWGWTGVGVVFAVYGTAIYATIKHDHNLRERCISEMPLNPQALVERRDWWLRWVHRGKLWVIGPLLGLIAAVTFSPTWLSHTVIILYFGVFQTWEVLSVRTHKILQPWCPYCPRNPGGGGGQFSPEPLPGPRGQEVQL